MDSTKNTCQAKNPDLCRYHGSKGTQKQISTLAEKIETLFKKNVELPIMSASDMIVNASTQPLQYVGVKPVWWDKYVKTNEKHATLSTTPELLNIIGTPMGNVAVVWSNISQDPRDFYPQIEKGYRIQTIQLLSIKTGKPLGFIKAISKTQEAFETSFGTDEYAYIKERQSRTGKTFIPYDSPEEPNNEEAFLMKRKTLLAMYSSYYERPSGVTVNSLQLEHISSDPKEVNKQFTHYANRFKKEYIDSNKGLEDAHIDYSSVEKPLRGQGFGSLMYVYAARMLGNQNKMLRASSIQSEEAQKLWQNLAKNLPKNMKQVKIKRLTGYETFPALNFSNKTSIKENML